MTFAEFFSMMVSKRALKKQRTHYSVQRSTVQYDVNPPTERVYNTLVGVPRPTLKVPR